MQWKGVRAERTQSLKAHTHTRTHSEREGERERDAGNTVVPDNGACGRVCEHGSGRSRRDSKGW